MTVPVKPEKPTIDIQALIDSEPEDGVFCVPADWKEREGSPAGRKKRSPRPRGSKNWPKTVDEAVQQILSKMSAKDRRYLLDLPREKLLELHFTWGMGIRNGCGLWGGNEELLRDCGRKTKWVDRDSASWVIMEAVWDELHKPAAVDGPDGGGGCGGAA